MKSKNSKKDANIARADANVNPKTLQKALRTLKARFATNDITQMREIPEEYVTGIRSALGIGYDTMIGRFNEPGKLTFDDILNTADITDTDYAVVAKVALEEAIKNHIKRDITELLPKNSENED